MTVVDFIGMGSRFRRTIPDCVQVGGATMNFVIRGLNTAVSETVRSHVERRLAFALERFANHVRLVLVRVSHLNGTRRGMDKRCQVEVRMRSMAPIWVEAVDDDIYAAVDQVADRLGHMLAREVEKSRTSTRPLARAS